MSDPWAKLCVGRPCIRCGADDGTIVPAHANQIRLGKGMGTKAYPWTVIPLCMTCHTWLDNGQADRVQKYETYAHCWNWHMAALLQAELIAPVGHVPRDRKPQRLRKILPRSFPPEAA